MIDFAQARINMVDNQLRTVDVTDLDVLGAFLAVPREMFVPEEARALAYVDRDVPLGGGRYLIEAGPFAKLVQAAELDGTQAVLLVVSATGYGAAVLARLCATVAAVEAEAPLAVASRATLSALGVTNVGVVEAPLTGGHPAGAPYDVILLEGSVDEVPDTLFRQLAEGGTLLAVVGRGRTAQATSYRRSGGGTSGRPLFDVAIPALPGFQKAETFAFSL